MLKRMIARYSPLFGFCLLSACSESSSDGAANTGGALATGGSGGAAPTGGTSSATGGGKTTGGAPTGGTSATGGAKATGGAPTGGKASSGGVAGAEPGTGGTNGGEAAGGSSGQAGGGASGTGGSAGASGAGPSGAICPPGPYADDPIPAGATPEVVCKGMTFTEGAVWFADPGVLYFSDFDTNGAADNFNGTIVQYTPGGACSDLIEDAGTNGLAIWTDGNILGARHLDQTLTIFNRATSMATPLVEDYMGDPFSSPNDLTVRSDGNVYFTDPAYQVGNRDEVLDQAAYRRAPDGTLSLVEELARPNGISLSPDETLLYVAHSNPSNVRAYDLDAAGAISNPRVLIDSSGSDGMAIDCAGNLYLTSGGVRVFSPDGEMLGTIPAQGATNVAFGGPERRTLYITAGGELRAVELDIPGYPY